MGRQIGIALSQEGEQALEAFLLARFPTLRVVDRFYVGPGQKQVLLQRSTTVDQWLIIDKRVEQVLRASASEITEGPYAGQWHIRSRGESCIEWDRHLLGRPDGRLYLDTTPHVDGTRVRGMVGDEVKRMYAAAVRWIRTHCHRREPSSRFPVWSDAA